MLSTVRQTSEDLATKVPATHTATQSPSEISTDHETEPRQGLCEACSKLDIRVFFHLPTIATVGLGLLEHYQSPHCPFCQLISHCIRLHFDQLWDTRTFCLNCSEAPSLRVSCKLRENHLLEGTESRVILSVNQAPPGIPIPVKGMLVFAELELCPSKVSTQSRSNDDDRIRSLRRSIQTQIDYGLVKDWIGMCSGHGHVSIWRQFQHEDGLRVVDVVDECLAERTFDDRYLALSYVWGAVDHLRLQTLRQNVQALSLPHSMSEKNSLKLTGKRVPQIIGDAMNFVKSIGERYLWVDSLCIVQDDPEEKSRLIHGMNSVYESAVCTIAAVSSEHADSRLPGVDPRKELQYEKDFVIPTEGRPLRIAACRPYLPEHLRKAPWSERGWTLQEYCLSRGCIFFTSDELIFDCQHAQFREGYSLESRDSKPSFWCRLPNWLQVINQDQKHSNRLYLSHPLENLNAFGIYREIVLEYNERNLSHPEDALHAFAGIYNRFCPLDSPNLGILSTQGIPPALLPAGLLWFASARPTKRMRLEKDQGEPLFSSWSWASWTGTIEYLDNGNSGLARSATDRERRIYGDVHGVCNLSQEWHFGTSAGCQMMQISKQYSGRNWRCDVERHVPYLKLSRQILHNGVPPNVSFRIGQLGFWAPTLAFPFDLQKTEENTHQLMYDQKSRSCGRFRFDTGSCCEVDRFVAITGDGSSPFFTVLGTCTRNGQELRIGIGAFLKEDMEEFLEYSKSEWRWEYVHLS